VDVHYFKAGDSWPSISKQHFGDERFGAALKAYNANAATSPNQPIDVPPIHVLRRKYPDLIAAAAVAEPPIAKPASGERTYEIPAGGLTFKEIAKRALGDENYWGQVWDLNRKHRADEPLPAGVRIRLPAESKIGE
jgi:nucleoid-associated protein YgaU